MKRDRTKLLLHPSGISQNRAGRRTLRGRREAETQAPFLAGGAKKNKKNKIKMEL